MGIFCLSDSGHETVYDAGMSSVNEVRKWILELLTKNYEGSTVIKELQQHFEASCD